MKARVKSHKSLAFDFLAQTSLLLNAGSGSIQAPPGTVRCTITDRNTLNDPLTPPCQ